MVPLLSEISARISVKTKVEKRIDRWYDGEQLAASRAG